MDHWKGKGTKYEIPTLNWDPWRKFKWSKFGGDPYLLAGDTNLLWRKVSPNLSPQTLKIKQHTKISLSSMIIIHMEARNHKGIINNKIIDFDCQNFIYQKAKYIGMGAHTYDPSNSRTWSRRISSLRPTSAI